MRRVLAVLHRWFGLFTAVFLFIAGFTGAIISWDHELDAWLNPELFHAPSAAASPDQLHDAFTLADRVEAADARVRVRYLPLSVEPTQALQLFVEPRVDPESHQPYTLGFDQLAVNPESAEVQARRLWGQASLSRHNLLPFLYKLHYTLHIPDAFGFGLGTFFMGIVAFVWLLDCFIALWLAFPSRKSWRKSLAFRLHAGRAKLTFDLHRSGGVWVWGLLLILAVSAVSMNLQHEVVRPIVALFSPLSEGPFQTRVPNPVDQPIEPLLSRVDVVRVAELEAQRQSIETPAGGLFYSADVGVYGVGFFEPGHDHGDGGLGNPWLYFDARDGRFLGGDFPGQGSAGDVFLQAQFPLHSGRILGLPGRVLVSLLGMVVALLSVTGVLIWARRLRANAQARAVERKRATSVVVPETEPGRLAPDGHFVQLE